MDFNKLLNVSTQLGKMLLENGAEICRSVSRTDRHDSPACPGRCHDRRQRGLADGAGQSAGFCSGNAGYGQRDRGRYAGRPEGR